VPVFCFISFDLIGLYFKFCLAEAGDEFGVEERGTLCRISPSGRIYVQDHFGVTKRVGLWNLVTVEEEPFDLQLLADSPYVIQMWADLFSSAIKKVKMRDWTQPSGKFLKDQCLP